MIFGFKCYFNLVFVSSRGAGVDNTFVVVCRFLIAVASLTVEHGLEAHGLQELWCGL